MQWKQNINNITFIAGVGMPDKSAITNYYTLRHIQKLVFN